MICSLCQERPATSRGLCSACYQRERKAGRLAAHTKRQRPTCSVEGCTELAARMNSPLESDEGVPVADMVHWCHPSAEMVAARREVKP